MTDGTILEPLLQRLRAGDHRALAALFDHWTPRLRQMLRLHMGTRLTARVSDSDVLQDAYLDAARQVQAYLRNPRVAFYVWLRGLVWERLLNLQRQHLGAECRAAGREQTLPAESSLHLAQRLLARDPSPGHALLAEEQRQLVHDALDRLHPEDREVILLRHFEGLSNREVAQALDLSDSGATMRYGRALIRLKDALRTLLTEETQP